MIIMHKTGICPLSYNLTKNWLNKFKFLNIYCIAGGRGKTVLESLDNCERSKMHNFIYNGGLYLGICCGAYLARKKIIFDSVENIGLNIINENMYGPKYKNGNRYDYKDFFESRILDITDSVTSLNYKVFYRGGNEFIFKNNYHIYDKYERSKYKTNSLFPKNKLIIEALFKDCTPCIISKRVGKGLIVLSSIHPEHTDSNCDDIFYRIFSSYRNIYKYQSNL